MRPVIPIRDSTTTRRTPIVTWTFIAVNVFIFAIGLLRGGAYIEDIVMRFGVIPDVIVHGSWMTPRLEGGALGSVVTPVTSMFLHGGLLHLAGNMLFLHVFGDNVEDVLGRMRFVLFYVVCGVFAAAAQIVVNPNSTVPMIGASGAISGVLAGYMTLFPHARVVTLVPIIIFIRFIEVPAVIFIAVWFFMQLAFGYLSLGAISEGAQGVAWFAHIGGFLGGLFCIRFFFRRPRARRRRVTFR